MNEGAGMIQYTDASYDFTMYAFNLQQPHGFQ